MKTAVRLSLALAVAVLITAAANADKRPHEGKVVRVDPVAKVITVQGEKGDTWNLNVSETTKLKNNLVLEELQPGDEVHFDYVEKEGLMYATELRRTHKAKS
jgi:Cu/Ag efflux protein CusF